jgi:hypothetical protein
MEAALTPDTLNTIRAQAEYLPKAKIAQALGWSVDKLQRIARDRQIALEDIIRAPAGKPKFTPPRDAPELPPELVAIANTMPRRQAQVFRVLAAEAMSDGDPMNAYDIAARVGHDMTYEGARTALKHLDRRLSGTSVELEGSRGPGGGYRLVTARTL